MNPAVSMLPCGIPDATFGLVGVSAPLVVHDQRVHFGPCSA